MTSHIGSARRGFWGFWKRQLSSASGEDAWLSLARRSQASGLVAGTTRVGGADGKVIIERLCISLPYVETFNSKVIKGFVPELRSRYGFFVFLDSYVLCIYVMNILCTFHISVSWVCYTHTGIVFTKTEIEHLYIAPLSSSVMSKIVPQLFYKNRFNIKWLTKVLICHETNKTHWNNFVDTLSHINKWKQYFFFLTKLIFF